MFEIIIQAIVTIVCAALASTGVWTFAVRRHDKKDATTQLLVGLAHDRIISLGTEYLKAGRITHSEYTNLNDHLYQPYLKCGGNGTAKKIMEKVGKLDIVED